MTRRKAFYWLVLLALVTAFAAVSWIGFGTGDSGSAPAADMRPAFTLPDLSGEQRSIAEWDGQVVVLNFWATWCPPCVEEMPELVAVQKSYGGRGLQVVGVAMDDPQSIRAFLQDVPVNYPVLHSEAKALEIMADYGHERATLPFTVVIGRDGTIRERLPRATDAKELATLVEPLLER